LHPEKVGSQHQRAQDVIGYAGACISQNLDVARLHPHHGEGINATVHASDNGEALSSTAGKARVFELGVVPIIGCQNISE
jgi:hypothetical protein